MAQDEERDEQEASAETVDPSGELDMVSIFSSQTIEAESEADVIRGLLEANGIPAIIVGNTQVPILIFEVKVPLARVEDARRVIAEAQAAGPEAAAEAEAASEEGQ